MRLFRAALVLLAAGVGMAAVAKGTTAKILSVVLLGIAGVLLVSFAFLVVGESEDRDRIGRPQG